ncbi:MAG TPA: glycosyltransferase family 4 protein [Acidobacteriota bacterium]|nr:glycosyltransferase family 4 protein [Acidobacteriota bacterium]
MKILLVNSLYHPNVVGGAERSVQILAEGLREREVEPVVVSTAAETTQGAVNGVRVYYLKVPNLYWMRTAKEQPGYKKPFWHLIDSYNPLAVSVLGEVFDREEPQVVHTNNLAGISAAAWKEAGRRNIPIVHTIRDHYLLCPRGLMYKHGRICRRQCLDCRLLSVPRRRLSRSVSAAVGVSRFILEKHLSFGYFENARIRTHIYSSMSACGSVEKKPPRPGVIRFGYVGQLAPAKGIEYLLERMAGMTAPGVELHVFGRGFTDAYERYLMARYGAENVTFMGYRRPEEIYGAVDVGIIPSLCDDAFPRILIEAYACGVPVIATGRGGAPEMVEEGTTGFVFDPGKPGDLEKQMNRFVTDRGLASRMSVHCRAAAAEFRTDKTVDRYLEIYRRVIG